MALRVPTQGARRLLAFVLPLVVATLAAAPADAALRWPPRKVRPAPVRPAPVRPAPVTPAPVPPAAPAGLYVDRDSVGGRCKDSRPVSNVRPATPLCSLQRAIDLVPGGGTIVVRRGRYPHLALTQRQPGGTVSIVAYGGERPELQGITIERSRDFRVEGLAITDVPTVMESERITFARNDVSPRGFWIAGGSQLRFEGNHVHDLVIDMQPASAGGIRCYSGGPGVHPRCGHGFKVNNVSDIVISGNHVHHLPADGIQAVGLTRAQITGNWFHDISPSQDPAEHSDGMQLVGANRDVTISGNVVTDSRGFIVQPFSSASKPGSTQGLVIENNVLMRIRHWSLNLLDTTGVRIVNNTIWEGGTKAVWLREETTNPDRMEGAVIANNILSHLEAESSMLALEDHNLVASGHRAGPNDLEGSPGLVTGSAQLAPDSIAIDAGLADLAPKSDSLGRGRVSAPDLGAIEFGGTAGAGVKRARRSARSHRKGSRCKAGRHRHCRRARNGRRAKLHRRR